MIAEDTFRTGDGVSAHQIALSQVGPLAVGVALVSYQDALPFLQAGKLLTHQSLALLIVNGPDDLQTTHSVVHIAVCSQMFCQSTTSLAVRVFGPTWKCPSRALFQDRWISCRKCACCMCPLSRFMLTNGLGTGVSLLTTRSNKCSPSCSLCRTCRKENCQCDLWHQDPQLPATEVLLDVFRRHFFTDGGRPTRPANATHFSVQGQISENAGNGLTPFVRTPWTLC